MKADRGFRANALLSRGAVSPGYNQEGETPNAANRRPQTAAEPTEEQWEKAMEWLRAHPYGEQDENGIDISLLRENQKLTPTQRIQNNMRALRLRKEFDRAAEANRLSRNS